MNSRDKSIIVRQYFHTLFFTCIKIAATISLIYLIGKNLHPSENSDYALIRSSIEIGTYILGMDIYVFLGRYIPGRPRAESIRMFKSVFVLELAIALFICGVLLVTGLDLAIARSINIANTGLFRLGIAMLLVGAVSTELMRLFRALRMIEVSNIVNFLRTHSWIFILLVMWAMGTRIDLAWIMGFWFAGLIISGLYGLVKLGLLDFLRAPMDTGVYRRAISFVWPIYLSTAGAILTGYLDIFILSILRTPEETGIYAYAKSIVIVGILFTATMTEDVLAPHIVASYNRRESALASRLLSGLLKYALVTVVFFIVLFGLSSKEVLTILAKPGYLAATSFIPILLLATFIRTLTIPMRQVLLLKERVRLLSAIDISGAVITLSLTLALVERFSMTGAALALVFSNTFVAVAMTKSAGPYKLFSFMDAKVPGVLAAGGLSGALLFGIHYMVTPFYETGDGLHALIVFSIMAVSFAVIYAAALLVFRVLDGADVTRMMDFFTDLCRSVWNRARIFERDSL
ncbi:MAG: lipopolysaccharide biosynthesis protein [Thermodesulfobacteriota bacterium]